MTRALVLAAAFLWIALVGDEPLLDPWKPTLVDPWEESPTEPEVLHPWASGEPSPRGLDS